jgi:hypothetical protein
MSTLHRRRTGFSTFAAVLAFVLCAPQAANAEDEVIAAEQQILAAAPTLSSWDESSGYGSVEASRAAIGHDHGVSGYGPTGHEASALGLSWDEMSGYRSVEASRAEVSALLSGARISGRDQALAVTAAAATLWDSTSGYGSVEASRAANALPAAPATFTNQVPSDVRWAPERALEHTIDPQVAAAKAWDETSGYGAVEASRASR